MLLGVLVMTLVWFLTNHTLPNGWLYSGAGLVGVFMLVIFYVQQKIDTQVIAILEQTNFAATEEFDSLYDRSPVAYVTIDVSGEIISFNPAAVHLFKATADTMAQVNFYQRILPSGEIDDTVLQSKISAGLTINDTEVLLQSASGKEVWVSMSVYSRREKNQRLISLMDVTEKKTIDTAKSEFVALATHQLRTPIAAIRWNVELLQRNMKDSVTPDQTRYLTKIERNVMRMISLINDFLSVSKLEMGTFATNSEVLNVPQFFDSVLDEFTEKITEKKLQLSVNENPTALEVKTDSRLLHIIVSNLVSNAVKYIKIEGKLTLKYRLEGGMLQILIADDGIGVPKTEVGKLFTKFYRASNAQSHQTEGTGLGLYVVKASVEKLGGKISFETEENVGTKFTINLPVTVMAEG